MKKILLGVILLISVGVFAQQDPQVSQYMFTKLGYNAGYAGSSDAICANLLYRNQWVGFPGAPKTPMLNIDATVDAIHGGVGMSLFKESIGAEAITSAKISYAYRMNLGKGKLGIGVESGFVQKELDISQLTSATPGDIGIPTTSPNSIVPDLGFGLYYNTKDVYLGISTTHLLEGELDYTDNAGNGAKLKIARHYYINAGYNYQFKNPDLVLKPSVLIKSDGVETQFDFANITLMYKDMLWGGLTYRLQDAIIPMVGLKWNNFKLGYAYDLTLSEIGNTSSGSHEIMLGYCYPLTKKTITQIYRNVLFL